MKRGLTQAESEVLASHLLAIQSMVLTLDVEYVDAAADGMLSQASRQETMSILNPSYPQESNDLIREQGKALQHLAAFIKSLNKCTELKAKVGEKMQQRKSIDKFFL